MNLVMKRIYIEHLEKDTIVIDKTASAYPPPSLQLFRFDKQFP